MDFLIGLKIIYFGFPYVPLTSSWGKDENTKFFISLFIYFLILVFKRTLLSFNQRRFNLRLSSADVQRRLPRQMRVPICLTSLLCKNCSKKIYVLELESFFWFKILAFLPAAFSKFVLISSCFMSPFISRFSRLSLIPTTSIYYALELIFIFAYF